MTKHTFMLCLAVCITFSNSLYAKENILIKNEGLYPEGINYDADKDLFYISSVARGEVWSVTPQGKTELFAKNKKFASTIGLRIDKKNNRLLVCVSDPGVGKNSKASSQGKLAGLVVYDLGTKKELAYYELTPLKTNTNHFANDVAIDNSGNYYITDSFSPIIYKVDTQGNVSSWANSPLWKVAKGKFGLNGIAYHPNGFLIVSHYDSGILYKVDINNPQNIKPITNSQPIEEWNITGLDGLLLINANTLTAVNNDTSGRKNGNVVYRLTSSDDWRSFKIHSTMPTTNTYPTTLTNNGDDVFVLHANLHELFSGNKSPVKEFEIEQVLFKPIK